MVLCDLMAAAGIRMPSEDETSMHCLTNINVKIARLASSGFDHQDSVLDIAGYAILWLAHLRREAANKGTTQ